MALKWVYIKTLAYLFTIILVLTINVSKWAHFEEDWNKQKKVEEMTSSAETSSDSRPKTVISEISRVELPYCNFIHASLPERFSGDEARE